MVHKLTTQEPLSEDNQPDLRTNCGLILKNAQIVRPGTFDPEDECRDCSRVDNDPALPCASYWAEVVYWNDPACDPRADLEAAFAQCEASAMPGFLKKTVRDFRSQSLGPDPIEVDSIQ